MSKHLHPCDYYRDRHQRRLCRHTPAFRQRRAICECEENIFYGNTYGMGVLGLAADLACWTVAKGLQGTFRLVEKAVDAHLLRKMRKKMAGLGLPTPDQLETAWQRSPRKKIKEALRLGAMLLEISSTLDASPIAAERGRVSGRRGGLKAWLAQYCPSIPYSTAIRYRKLAEQLLLLLGNQGGKPSEVMDWSLPDGPSPSALPPAEAAAIRSVRVFVGGLLTFHPSQRRLRELLVRALTRAAPPA